MSLLTRILGYGLIASLLVNGWLFLKHRVQDSTPKTPEVRSEVKTHVKRVETRAKDGTVRIETEEVTDSRLYTKPASPYQPRYSASVAREFSKLRPIDTRVNLGVRLGASPVWAEAGVSLGSKEYQIGVRVEL